jgi:hypothetical protein
MVLTRKAAATEELASAITKEMQVGEVDVYDIGGRERERGREGESLVQRILLRGSGAVQEICLVHPRPTADGVECFARSSILLRSITCGGGRGRGLASLRLPTYHVYSHSHFTWERAAGSVLELKCSAALREAGWLYCPAYYTSSSPG